MRNCASGNDGSHYSGRVIGEPPEADLLNSPTRVTHFGRPGHFSRGEATLLQSLPDQSRDADLAVTCKLYRSGRVVTLSPLLTASSLRSAPFQTFVPGDVDVMLDIFAVELIPRKTDMLRVRRHVSKAPTGDIPEEKSFCGCKLVHILQSCDPVCLTRYRISSVVV
jgi:hypothetical protein